MSQSTRQSELFASQDWTVIYKAFTQINFNASDPPSINLALRQYIQANYPEDFADWIESSEFVAIIDLLSWLGGTLAFKTDIDARENFMESAEARESILRLARFLSYNARRCQPARGLLKLKSVKTDDDVYDAFGNNLQNRTIIWNNADDADWFERMITVLNSAFVGSNPFGLPLKDGVFGGAKTQLYRLNSRYGDSDLGFTSFVSGTDMNFEVINADFDAERGFTERTPNLDSAMHMIYRADGNGNASARTGFFMAFKQGQMQRQVFQIDTPIENQMLNIDVNNINQTDVWVQTLNEQGIVDFDWEKVPAVFSENITYNAIDPAKRNIFSVITRDNDQVSVRFADGRFGAAPVGYIRVWYRTSNGLQYQIRPVEMNEAIVSFRYFNARGVAHTLTMVLSLEEPVSNAMPRETEEQIRRRAPQVYATQNRMVSGEDYNTFPLQSNLATKIKALARVYSGHSRFTDLNDPTGNYQDLNVFGDDGMFYKENIDALSEVPLSANKSPAEILGLNIVPMLKATELRDYVNNFFVSQARENLILVPEDLFWRQVSDEKLSSTGWFTKESDFIVPGTSLLLDQPGKAREWVTIATVFNSAYTPPTVGFRGPVTLAASIKDGARVVGIIPPYASSIPTEIQVGILSKIERTLSFSLWYDYNVPPLSTHWTLRDPSAIHVEPKVSATAIKVMNVEYLTDSLWRFTTPGLRFVFESDRSARFYFDGQRTVKRDTGTFVEDTIRILKINENIETPEAVAKSLGIGRHYDLTIQKMIREPDGYSDPRRVAVTFKDRDQDGFFDDPDTYYHIVSHLYHNQYLFWARRSDATYVPIYNMVVYENETERLRATTTTTGSFAFQIQSGSAPNSFWRKTATGWEREFRTFRFARGRGANVAASFVFSGGSTLPTTGDYLKFQWKHYAPLDRRIDPAKSNIIDMFVLSSEYDFVTRQWIASGADSASIPPVPTELELRNTFAEYENHKMFTDDIVWRPVSYRFLFGNGAAPAYRATFKVVKLHNATLSDAEIKTRVIKAIGNYFSPDYWEFGETFYYTELAAYIHQELVSNVASVVLVPESADAVFGDGFEVRCRSDELFISTAQVSDVKIIDANTPTNLRIH